MNVLVIGAAGRTGRLVVDRAVAAGHTATALVRNPESYRPSAAGVRVVAGDEKAHEITRADVAQFLVDQLQDDTYLGRSVTIANQ